MRKLRNNFRSLLCLSLLAFAGIALGKTAPEYYHEGATNYVHGKWPQAKSAVTNGLALFPKDGKLLALSKLLENQQQQQQQDQQQQDQEKEKQEQKDQQSKQNQPQQEQEQEKKDQQQEQQQQKPSDKQEQSQEKKPGEEGKDAKEQKEGGNGAAQQLLQMTPEQAQRLLEAVKSDEKVMIFTPQFKTNRNNRVLKDW